MTGLTAVLSDIAPVYEIPDDDLIGEVLVPAMSHADEVWVGSGYFSSCCLAQVASGLADFKRSEAPLKLLISPEIGPEDWAAIRKGVTTEQDLVDQLAIDIFGNDGLSESTLAEHTRECFAYLIEMPAQDPIPRECDRLGIITGNSVPAPVSCWHSLR